MKVKNKKTIRRLSSRILAANKSRNIIAALAIFLAGFLITATCYVGVNAYVSYSTILMHWHGTTADAVVNRPTNQQVELLRDNDDLAAVGTKITASMASKDGNKDFPITMTYFDENAWDMDKTLYDDIHGDYPAAEDEIMMSVAGLKALGIEAPSLGMEITLQCRNDIKKWESDYIEDTERTFRLSGYYTDSEESTEENLTSATAFVSRSYAETTGNTIDTQGRVFLRYGDNIPNDVDAFEETLEDSLNLQQGQSFTSYYNSGFSEEQQYTVIAVAIVMLLMMLSGYLLIYNIFYLSVSKDIRDYGLLKTIGTTKSQLKSIIRRQALFLCIFSIPLGIGAGILLGQWALPAVVKAMGGGMVSYNPRLYPLIPLLAAVFSLLTVLISVNRPAKLAGKISPVEATRYTGPVGKKKIRRSSKGGKISRMAFRNVFRDKKRAFVVIVSLFLGLTVFSLIITLVKAMDTENYIDSVIDSPVEINNSMMVDEDGNFYTADAINDDVLAFLNNVDGVTKVSDSILTLYEGTYSQEYDSYLRWIENTYHIPFEGAKKNMNGALMGVDSDYLIIRNNLTTEEREAFDRGELAFVQGSYSEDFTLPETFAVKNQETGAETTIKNGGGIDLSAFPLQGQGQGITLIVSKEFARTYGIAEEVNVVYVEIEESKEVAATEEIQNYVENTEGLQINSRESLRDSLDTFKIIMNGVGGGMALVLAVIGIMNFINVMVSGTRSRKRELTMMESIGMTKKQMRQMLLTEGAYYAVISLGLLWTVGTALGYVLFLLFREQADYAVYSFPFLPLLAVSAAVLVICLVVPMITYNHFAKESITDRLRTE